MFHAICVTFNLLTVTCFQPFLSFIMNTHATASVFRLPFRSADRWLMANQGKGKSRRSLNQLMRQVINIWNSIMIQSSTLLNGVVMNLKRSVCLVSVVTLRLWEEVWRLPIAVFLWLPTEVHWRGRADVHVDPCGGYRLQVGWKCKHASPDRQRKRWRNLNLWVKSRFYTLNCWVTSLRYLLDSFCLWMFVNSNFPELMAAR